MAYANTTSTITIADRFAALRANLKAAAQKRKVYRNTLSELTALNDRELADLGINRSMIKTIALDAVKDI